MDSKNIGDNEELRGVPEPTLRRLPGYLHVLRHLQSQGRDVVSCPKIGEELKLNPVQVRKDLAATGIVGKSKVGYNLPELILAIENFLGWNNISSAFLVGVGHLGTALLGHDGFNQYGLSIVAAFDTDPAKIGQQVHGKEVLALDKLPSLCHRMYVHIGVLTVPPAAAQSVADMMVAGGMRAIWNFAPVALKVPGHVIVENVDLATSLAVLSSRLSTALKAAPMEAR